MITEITQSNPSQSLIEHDILLQQLQLQQLIILGLVLLVILLIPVAIIMFKRQKQASTYWRSLFQEIEQVNQDVTFRNQTQEAIIASLRERMQTLENQKPAEPSYDEYTEILGFYRKINQPLISFLESIQLSSYEIFICILIFEKVSLKSRPLSDCRPFTQTETAGKRGAVSECGKLCASRVHHCHRTGTDADDACEMEGGDAPGHDHVCGT